MDRNAEVRAAASDGEGLQPDVVEKGDVGYRSPMDMFESLDASPNLIAARVARYRDLNPLPIRVECRQNALDIVYARKLLPVIGLESGATAVSAGAPIDGAAGITVTLAVCPPGQGPELHAHKATFETFTVLQGTFEFRYGDHGQHGVTLDRFDTVSMPPRVHRSFRNISDEEGIVQVIISGGTHDSSDILMNAQTTRHLKEASPELLASMSSAGITFADE